MKGLIERYPVHVCLVHHIFHVEQDQPGSMLQGEFLCVSYQLSGMRLEGCGTNYLAQVPRLVLSHARTDGDHGTRSVPQQRFGIGPKQQALDACSAVSSQHNQVHIVLLDRRKKLVAKWSNP